MTGRVELPERAWHDRQHACDGDDEHRHHVVHCQVVFNAHDSCGGKSEHGQVRAAALWRGCSAFVSMCSSFQPSIVAQLGWRLWRVVNPF